MKIFNNYILFAFVSLVGLSSCEKLDDNYDSYNAKFHGTIIDSVTGEQIPQDLLDGTWIDYQELGFDNPHTQTMRCQTLGTFRNNLMFSADYIFFIDRCNFFPIDTTKVTIDGDTEYTFKTRPYIALRELVITDNVDGNKVVATFKVEQIDKDNPVKRLFFYADKNPNLGKSIQEFSTLKNLRRDINGEEEFSMSIKKSLLKKGGDYFFRVGAIIDREEAKINYSIPVRYNIDN